MNIGEVLVEGGTAECRSLHDSSDRQIAEVTFPQKSSRTVEDLPTRLLGRMTGDPFFTELAAAIGFAGMVQFFMISVSIGLVIAGVANRVPDRIATAKSRVPEVACLAVLEVYGYVLLDPYWQGIGNIDVAHN